MGGIGVTVGVGGTGVKVKVAIGTGVSVGVEIDAGVQETRTIARIMTVSSVLDFIFSLVSRLEDKRLTTNSRECRSSDPAAPQFRFLSSWRWICRLHAAYPPVAGAYAELRL